jgi:hypothetical protein
MFLVGIFQWWYGSGWLRHIKRSYVGILRTADFFSIGLLLKTLFNPFRQISAGSVQGPFPVQLKAFADRLFSRCIGAVFRTLAIFMGMVVITVHSVWTLASIIIWTLLPLTPCAGVALWMMGVTL